MAKTGYTIRSIMGMQNRIYKAGAKWDQLYNDTAVDYSLQLEALWRRLRSSVSVRMGGEVVSNIIHADFSQQDTTSEMSTLEVG